MEQNKALEMLLRRAGGGSSPLPAQQHLDADTVAAFAANSLPQSARNLYIPHLADCDRCRLMLANATLFEPAALPEAVPARIVIGAPWWRSILRVPAYTYAGLFAVLFFGGVIAFIALKGSEGSVEVSQIADAPASAAMPAEVQERQMSEPKPVERKLETAEPSSSVSKEASVPAPPPPPSLEIQRKSAPPPAPEYASAPPPAPPVARSDAMMDREDGKAREEARSDEAAALRAAPAPKSMAGAAPEQSVTVGGRLFIRRNGVWTDRTQCGGQVTNVARGSAEFAALDGGLRELARELSGPIQINWQGRCYRIQ